MRKYPKYKECLDWIREIPSEWVSIKYKFVANIETGSTPPKADNTNYEGGDILFVKPDELNGFTPIHDSKEKITKKAFENSRLIKESSLLTCAIGTIGKFGIAGTDCITNQQINSFTFNPKKINPKFGIYSFIASEDEQWKNSTTNVVAIINKTSQSRIYIPYPSLPEQHAIVRFLDYKTGQIDSFITNRQKQIELLKEQKAGIINKAVTKGINPNAKMKDSGIEWIGEIPENWMAKKIKYAGRIINGYAFDSKDFKRSGVRVVKIANIQTRSIEWKEESFVEKYLYDELVNFRLKKDDLVFALTRPIISTGIKAAIIETNEPMLINQRNAVFRPKSINRRFLYYIIYNEDFIQFFESLIDNTGQQPNISSEDIANIAIPFPSLSEQIDIVDFLDTRCNELDTLISKYQKQIDLMQEYRTSLISQAVTGKIDVREWEPKKKQTV